MILYVYPHSLFWYETRFISFIIKNTDVSCHIYALQMISSDINQASTTLHKLSVILSSYRQCLLRHPDVTGQDVDYIGQLNLDLVQLHQKWQTIFMWQDGPLVEAMKKGELFLVDEISLADDSVLERLNSVLEPERKLVVNLSWFIEIVLR